MRGTTSIAQERAITKGEVGDAAGAEAKNLSLALLPHM